MGELLKKIQKKEKSCKNLKAFQVKSHLWVFVNSQIENPAFDSQTKETLITRASNFGSKFTASDKLIKQLMNTPLVENIMSWAQFKQSKDLKKTDGTKRLRLTGIPKLDDANNAGGRNSKNCTLILTEGRFRESIGRFRFVHRWQRQLWGVSVARKFAERSRRFV